MQRLHAIAKTLLQGGAREVESVADMIDLVDEPNLPLLIRGDVSLGAVVRCAGAVVVEGKVEGVSDMPCRILAEGPVVVMGNVKHAHIRGRGIFFGRSTNESNLVAEDEIYVAGDVFNVVAQLGDAETIRDKMDALRDVIRAGREEKEDLLQQIRHKRQQLDNLLAATGITFNLNIGQIIKYTDSGLMINLTSFYNALQGRSEREIDQALREFFAKAVLGVLTRLNKQYISAGKGHQTRFSTVVYRLQELVFDTRNYDRLVEQIQAREAQFWAHGERFDKSDGTMSVLGVVMPHFRLCFSRLIKNEMLDSDVQAELSRSEMMLRPGKRRGTHEVVLKHNNEAVDLLFITPEQVQKVEFTAVNDRIEWSSVL